MEIEHNRKLLFLLAEANIIIISMLMSHNSTRSGNGRRCVNSVALQVRRYMLCYIFMVWCNDTHTITSAAGLSSGIHTDWIGKIALAAEQLLSSPLNSLWDKSTDFPLWFLLVQSHIRSHCHHVLTGWGITWVAKIVPIQYETSVYMQKMFLPCFWQVN